jgi:nucleoside-diphosphate-sugar epimerase
MRSFVTGASGWIGSGVVAELIGSGHQVVGLARSDASAETVAAAGAEVRRGDIGDRSDRVVHLAFRHDRAFTGDMETAVNSDLAAIEALGDALAGTDRPLMIASTIAGVNPERSPPNVTRATRPRQEAELSTSRRHWRSPNVGCDRSASALPPPSMATATTGCWR